jgi:hypothetical protein
MPCIFQNQFRKMMVGCIRWLPDVYLSAPEAFKMVGRG